MNTSVTKKFTNTPARFRIGERVICYRRGEWWWAEYYIDRRQQRRPLNTKSKKEAGRRAIRLEGELQDGQHPTAPPVKTVEEIIKLYTEHLKTEDRSAGTLKRYGPEFRRWQDFLAGEGVVRIGDISLAWVEKYRSQRKAKVAPATLYHETIIIKQLLNFAHERGFIAANPLKKMKMKRPRPAPQPCFSKAEVEAICTAGGVFADVFELAAFTGLRIGEIRWLTWEDIELDTDGNGGFIHVREKPGEWRPKDGDNRKIPMHPRIMRLLAGRDQIHRFVFTAPLSKKYPRGGHQFSDRHALAKLKKIIVRLGIAEGTLHAFRRFFISHCANNGVEPFKLMQWVGHSDISVVLRYYRLGDDESYRSMVAVPFDSDETVEDKKDA